MRRHAISSTSASVMVPFILGNKFALSFRWFQNMR